MATSGTGPTGGGAGGAGSGGPSGVPNWTANITSRDAVAGPAGTTYADVPSRIGAFIIDVLILFVVGMVLSLILNAIVPVVQVNPNARSFADLVTFNPIGVLVQGIAGLAVSAAYFVFTWTNPQWRASVGQRALGMQVGNEADGAAVTVNQAVVRWALLFGPQTLASFLYGVPTIGMLISLLALVWAIVLLVTTAQSPTKQGLHDRYARTVVIRGGNRLS